MAEGPARGTWLVFRIGVLAAGWNAHELSGRRWALAGLVAGGPFANLVALAVLCGTAWLAPSAYDTLEPFGLAELAAVALTLYPTTQAFDGRQVPTDGLRLYRLAVQGRAPDLAAAYAEILRPVLPSDAPPHPLTPHAPDILYEILRRDRWAEAWACRDAVTGFRKLLETPSLSAPERALLLSELVVLHLLLGLSGTTPAELEAWSAEAGALCAMPRTAVARGALLVATDNAAEGEAILLPTIVEMKDRRELISATGALATASLGKAEAMLSRSRKAGWFDVAHTIARRFGRRSAVDRAVTRIENETSPAEAAPEPRRTRLTRWFAGVDLP